MPFFFKHYHCQNILLLKNKNEYIVSLLSRKLFAHTRAYLRIMKHKLHERIKRTDSLQKMDFTLNRVSSTFSFRGMNFLLVNWSDLFVSSKLCKLERKIECRFFFNLTKIEIARLEQYILSVCNLSLLCW